jgi:predicted patatin/cPLA2 family phospholipase
MANCNALENDHTLLDWFRTQAITTKNYRIHNYFLNVPSKKRKHFSIYSNNVVPIITKDNNILELQGFLKHNDFAKKSTNKFLNAMFKCLTKTNQ